MPPHQKTTEELEQALYDQLAALRASTTAYDTDQKKRFEILRMANAIYILCHDGHGKTKSLLGLTGRRNRLEFISSAVTQPENSGGTVEKVQATLNVTTRLSFDSAEYIALFDQHPMAKSFKWLPLRTWWEESIFHPKSSLHLSRKNLICSVRDQDGGGHVDTELTKEAYAKFKYFGDPEIRFHGNGTLIAFGDPSAGKPVLNGVEANIRQIAWEVDQSLKNIGL